MSSRFSSLFFLGFLDGFVCALTPFATDVLLYPRLFEMKILTWNVRKTMANEVNLSLFAEIFRENNIDIVLIQESGLRKTNLELPSCVSGYSIIPNFASSNLSKTTAFLVDKKSENSILRIIKSVSGDAISIGLKLGKNVTLCITNVYVPAGIQTASKNDRKRLYDSYKSVLDRALKFSKKHTISIVAGDFNQCFNYERSNLRKYPALRYSLI